MAESERIAATAYGVSRRYGDAPALDNVDAELRRGEITALAGPNGAGKTTLLRILAGILPPSAGEVRVLGVDRPTSASRSVRRSLRRRIAYLPQDPALDPEMTGRETLALLAALYGVGRRERQQRIAELAAAFGVATHLERLVSEWSGGLRRRLHLAAGMIHDPELLLLDEPTAGLDADGTAALWAELRGRAAAGRAVAIVTHDHAAVAEHADRVIALAEGRIADPPGADR